MRLSDSAMVRRSSLDNFLFDIQVQYNPNGRIFCTYGDRLFTLSRCICRAHKAPAHGPPLTPIQRLQNKTMNGVREEVEHAFAGMGNQCQILRRYGEFKLDQENPHAVQQIRICHLIYNIHTCLYHGSQVNGVKGFNCPPPSLETYLQV